MKYKLLTSKNNYYEDNQFQHPLNKILINRGVHDLPLGIAADKDNINSPFAFGKEEVEKAVEFLRFAVQEKHKICVIVDADADGFTSAAIILNYMYKLYHGSLNNTQEECKEKLTYILHDGKQHGLADTINKIEDDVKLVIIPDAGTNDINEMQQLIDSGKKILCMDHHESSNGIHNDNVVIINNQICDYPNKDLSGAGVTWQICRAYDYIMGLTDIDSWEGANRYIDLAALGMNL